MSNSDILKLANLILQSLQQEVEIDEEDFLFR
jgi:hypothetical protein